MHTRHLLDPDLAAILDQRPAAPPVTLATLDATRSLVAEQISLLRAMTPPYPAIEVREAHAPGPAGAPDVRVVVYRPRGAVAALPALLWIHGGGYVAGSPEWDDALVKALVDAVGCVVVSVDYRLAPETLHPGPVEDCHAALKWLHDEADALGVDVRRIGIAGLSAGGGLCAALGLLARDRGEVALCFQAPLQPMLDDRPAGSQASPHPTAGEFVWTRESNRFGWSALLGHEPGRDGVSPYAAAARAGDLAGLPQTYIAIGALDLFVDESIEYAQRLIRAGVPTELHVLPGACHGFNLLAPGSRLTQAWQRDFVAALRQGLSVGSVGPVHAADPALIERIVTIMPGISEADRVRFANSVGRVEPYALGADSLPREGVPRGSLRSGRCEPGAVYPGVAHDYSVYVPAQVDPAQAAALMVFQDGSRYLGPEINVPTVLDNLIHAGSLPPIVAVFVEPGATGPGLPLYGGEGNRSLEYDSTGDAYVRFLIDELLPEATRGLTIASTPAQRAICGLSSGGICAFNAAWERPDQFGKVVSHCGSFVNLRGGHLLACAVRAEPPRPLRVFLQSGAHDLDIVFGNWQRANQELAAALAYQGYSHQLVLGAGGHSLAHGGAIFPDTLRWLWQDTMETTT